MRHESVGSANAHQSPSKFPQAEDEGLKEDNSHWTNQHI
jgi:hypothetical protein